MTQNAAVAALPKAALHDHLDGGLRIVTVIELADAAGYRALPSTNPEELGAWFRQDDSGSLEQYLEAFDHTAAVMQTPDAVERVAYEAVTDLSNDGVVYAELRFAPALHTRGAMALEDVIEAALSGIARGRNETDMVVGLIPSALRQHQGSDRVAKATALFSGQGVVGFDIAGPEAGYPADDHLPAFKIIREAGLGLTIHAGEADGLNSIYRAVALCGAQRIGHGVRIIDDTDFSDGRITELGPLATRLRDSRIHLEVAVRSNVDTDFVPNAASHPLRALHNAGLSVSINTDNRLMSSVTTSDEYTSAIVDQGISMGDVGAMTQNALLAGFCDWDDRRRLIRDVVQPAYAALDSGAPEPVA